MITSFVRTSRAQRAVTPYAPQVYEFQTVFYSSSLKIHSSCTLYTLKRAGLLVACITTLYNSRNIQIRGVEKFSAMPDNFEHHASIWNAGKKKAFILRTKEWLRSFQFILWARFPSGCKPRNCSTVYSQRTCASSLQSLPLGVCALWSRLLVLF